MLLFPAAIFAQDSGWFYATMETVNAQTLKTNNPDDIQILSSSENLSAVYVNKEITRQLKESVNVHGPGYIYRKNEQAALSGINFAPQSNTQVLDFTITEHDFVNQCINMVSESNIGETILMLEGYGTRFHNTSTGIQAPIDIKDSWQDLVTAAGRNDITVELYNHNFTNQNSVILTIPGSQNPDEIVIIGGHLDSGDFWNPNNAPGADDNASGIAVLTETLRILLENNFRPLKTVQIMGYAAEEIGLFGSSDIAESYRDDEKNVLAVAQFDMTNYNGSPYDIALISDPQYTSSDLNLFLIDLMEHYNASGDHTITYGTSFCNYACSDHVSWTENGYLASFPFEAAFNDSNPLVHSPQDTFANMDNDATHSTKFVKLALEFVIEIAKVGNMATTDFSNAYLSVVVKDRSLIYNIENLNSKIQSLNIYNSGAKRVVSKSNLTASGNVSLQGLPVGVYIAVFKGENGQTYTKKFLIK